MNTAAGTKGNKNPEAENSRKLKLVPRGQPTVRTKLRIGICDGLFSPRPGNLEKVPEPDESPTLVLASESAKPNTGSGKWLAIAVISLGLGFLIGSRRK